MKHCQTNPDEAIDRLLAGLRTVEPTHGMQQRILRGAREKAGAQSQSSLQLPFTKRYSWMVTAASIAVIGLVASWTVARTHRNAEVATLRPAHLTATIAPIAGTRLTPAPIADTRSSQQSRRTSSEVRAEPAESVVDLDALALSEMNAPSRPAPPLPLTRQEKLLSDAVHQAGPEELASLRPEVRARQMELSKAEFRDFFDPPLAKGDE